MKAAGGRIRYVAGAALDHRRAGDDARLRALCARRLPPRPGQPPLRRLQGHARRRWRPSCACSPAALLHGPRRACMNGPVLSRALARAPARGAGRRRPAPAPAEDFLSGTSGTVGGKRGALLRAARRVARRARGAARARACAAPRAASRRAGACSRWASSAPARSWPPRAPSCVRSRHAVDVVTAPQGERGKFENLNALLAAHPPAAYDWLLVIDDDVALPRGFLDAFLCAAERTGLKLAQPAHRLHSHAAWPVTRRHPGATARETTFVEIGPVTAFHRDSFDVLLPFPEGLRMGWGLDVHWAAVAARARLADRDRRRHADRPHPAPGGQRLRRATRPRREARAFLAEPALRAPRRGAHAGGAPVKVRDRQRVLSARPRPGARASGPTARRSPRATPAPTCACSCCTGPSRRARRACATRRARCARWPRSRGAPSSTASTSRYVPVPRPAALAQLRVAGARGRRRRWRPPCAGCAASSPTTSSTPTTPCPPATPCCARAIGAPLVVSVHGGDVYFTAPRHPAGARAVRRAFGAARLVLANSAGIEAAARAPRRARARASCTWAPTSPSTPPPKARRPHARHRRATSSRASATPTSCARCGCCASATRSCAT